MLDMILRPRDIGRVCGGQPHMMFEWQDVRGKQRLIGIPNTAMRQLHHLFGEHLMQVIRTTADDGYGVRKLPSSFGCVPGSNPMNNAKVHAKGQWCFYITDLFDAYGNVSMERLALLITFLLRYDDYAIDISLGWFGLNDQIERLTDDWAYDPILSFLRAHFAGQYGRGLAVGGPLSPYLMNLYCEVFIDMPLRKFCERRQITYTRYVDDLVFSAKHFIGRETRGRIRGIIERGGFSVNHRKSWVRLHSMGQASVTKWGVERQSDGTSIRITYPQRKRRLLHGIIHSYLARNMDWPEKVSGYVAEFLHYYKQAERTGALTATDHKTMELCQQFKAEWDAYDGPKYQLGRRYRERLRRKQQR